MTNAARPWVERCIDRFAPGVRPIFEKSSLRIAYAREELSSRRDNRPVKYADEGATTQEEFDDMLTKSKFKVMKREAKDFYSQYPEQTWKNIVSAGDARYEKHAIQDVVFQRASPERERIRLKVFLTPTKPSIKDLTYRLRLTTVLIPVYISYDGDIDLDMNTPDRLRAIADALEMPQLREAIHPTPIVEEDEQHLSNTIDEVAVILRNTFLAP